MAVEMICTVPVGKYVKGDHVKDPAVMALLADVDHHFVRINSPDPVPDPVPVPEPRDTLKPPPLPKSAG